MQLPGKARSSERKKNGAAGSPQSSQLDPPRRRPTPLPKGADPKGNLVRADWQSNDMEAGRKTIWKGTTEYGNSGWN
jgi:hypothetical protein